MKLSGELDYRIRYDVEHDLFHAQNVFNDEYIKPTFIEYVQKLEAQIEKMKCCANCKKMGYNSSFAPICKVMNNSKIENPLGIKCDKWELAND